VKVSTPGPLAAFFLAFIAAFPVPGSAFAEDRIPQREPALSSTRATAEPTPSAEGIPTRTRSAPREGEMTEAKPRPTKIPEFTLPEVVITGENQLTIGAKRLERSRDDVTIGTRELRGLDRPSDDLPGLEKRLTGLSARPGDDPRRSTLILHPGAGTPSSLGGWALYGHETDRARGVLMGDWADSRGETVATGRIREKRQGYGLDVTVFPARNLDLKFVREYSRRTVDLPYSASTLERRGAAFSARADWRFHEGWRTVLRAAARDLPIESGDGSARIRLREPEASWGFHGDFRHPFLEGMDLEGVFLRSLCEPATGVSRSDRFHGHLALRLKAGSHVSALARAGAMRATGFDFPPRLDAQGTLSILMGSSTRLGMTFRREREIQRMHAPFLDSLYAVPLSGLTPPLDVQREFILEIARKIGERWLVGLKHRQGRWGNRAQWTDASGGEDPVYLRTIQTLDEVDFRRIASSIEFIPSEGWTVEARHEWQWVEEVSGSRLVTDTPLHEASLGVRRRWDRWESSGRLGGCSPMNAHGDFPGTYGSRLMLDLDARYRWTQRLSLWGQSSNITGRRYESIPGYPATRHQILAGFEVIL